jgi:RNA polymerase sigma-70 factor (ECF subfamily)
MFRIAHHQAVSWLRRHKPVVALDEVRQVSLEESPEAASIRSWRADQLQQALDQLSANHRAVIELAFVHGLSYAEIARVMDCPLGTVKSRMSYALQYLNGFLKRQGMGG